MSSLCLVVDGFLPETTAQFVGRYVSDKTGFCFDKVARVALDPSFSKRNVWILPLNSLEDQKKCLEALHNSETIPDGSVEEVGGSQVSLSLISLCLLPSDISWTGLRCTLEVDSLDYSLIDYEEKDQEPHSHPSLTGRLDHNKPTTLSLALAEAYGNYCIDTENKESLAVDNSSDSDAFANENNKNKPLDTRDGEVISSDGEKDLKDTSPVREDCRERSPATEDESTLHGDGDIIKDREDFTELSAGKNDSKEHAPDCKDITDSSFDRGDRSFATKLAERSPEREIFISPDTQLFKGSLPATVGEEAADADDNENENDFRERSPDIEDFGEMSPNPGNVSERPLDGKYAREGSADGKDLGDSSFARRDARDTSPVAEDVREGSPDPKGENVLFGDKEYAEDKEDFSEIEPDRHDFTETVTDREDFRDGSPTMPDFEERSSGRDEYNERSTTRGDGQTLYTDRDNDEDREDFRERSSDLEDFRERSPDRGELKERSPGKDDFRGRSRKTLEVFSDTSPAKRHIRDVSFDSEDSRNSSPARGDFRDGSADRTDFRKRSPDREDSRNSSPARGDFRDGSADRTDFRKRSHDREDSRNSSPAKGDFRDGSADRTDFRKRSPDREDSRDCSTAGGDFRGGSPHRENENNSYTEEDFDEDRDKFDEDNACANEEEGNQVDMYELLCAVKWTSVPVTCLQAALIYSEQTRNYIIDKFKEEGLMAVMPPYDPLSMSGTNGDVVTVRAFTDDDLVSAGVIIRTSVREIVIRLSENTASVVTLQTWTELCQTLLEKHEGVLLIDSVGPDKITIVGIEDIVDEVVKEVASFIEENTLYAAVSHLSPSRHKFIVLFSREKIKTINKQLKVYRVDIDIVWKKKLGEVLIKGTKKGLPLAKAELAKMEAAIFCHTIREKDRLRVKFLSYIDPDYEADLLDLFKDTRCVLSRKEEEAGLKVTDVADTVAGASSMGGDRDSSPSASSGPFQDAPQQGHSATLSASRKSTEDLIRVSVVQGDLTEEQTDVIVNTTTARLELKSGAVSAFLLKKGGPSLQAECRAKYPNGIRAGEIAITQGCGQLRCRQIYHTTLPGWSLRAKLLLEEVIGECLSEASSQNYHSIAFPALGTGALGYPCDEVAKTMMRTVRDFQRELPHTSLREVRIVIYYSDDESLLAFQDAQRQFRENPAVEVIDAPPHAGGGLRPPASCSEGPTPMSLPEKTIRGQGSLERDVPSDEPDFLQPNRTDFTERPSQSRAQKPKTPRSDELELELYLYTENKSRTSCLQDFQQKLDKAVHKRMITKDMLDETLEALSEQEEQLIVALGHQRDVKVQLHRRDGRLAARGLRIDVTEVLKGISDIITAVADRLHQERQAKELEMTRPPPFWLTHKPTEHVKLVRLSPGDPEYRAVEDRFNTTSWRHGSLRIIGIDRIQNPTLWRQYMAKRIHLDKQNQGVNNERTLWHGTPETSVHNINLNGFNRGYCGKNATSYGEGVYFAVDSGVSKQPQYSPPDAQGLRYVYQSKVLVGHFTEGNRRMKMPPARDGPILYDSLVDEQRKPSVFVIFNDTQAYPEYLVTFVEGSKNATSVVNIKNK